LGCAKTGAPATAKPNASRANKRMRAILAVFAGSDQRC
jgi:hypothetical protein